MKRFFIVTGVLFGASIVSSLAGVFTRDKETWLVATALGVATVVAAIITTIAALIERRWLFAVGSFALAALGFFAAYLDLLVGAVTASSTGRSLRVRGRLVLPPVVALDDPWLRDAQGEHASVAAFARLAWQLCVHGAPPDLIARAHRAALDELDHARRCFELAHVPYAAGPMRELSALDSGTLDSLARESLVDGCLFEGYGADLAEEMRDTATDPAVRRAMTTIAHDELTHAELAWDVLAWCLARGAAVDLSLPQRIAPGDPRISQARRDELFARRRTLVSLRLRTANPPRA